MTNSLWITTGRFFFALCITGIGFIHFFLPGVRPIIAPVAPDAVAPPVGYAVGLVLVFLGSAMLINKVARTVSLVLALFLLLLFVVGHLPQRLTSHPEILGFWTDAIKLIALAGGALYVVHVLTPTNGLHKNDDRFRAASVGQYFFALMLVLFGIDHFLYHDLVKNIVPGWIPFPLAWTYVTGVALIGAGLSVFIAFKVELIMYLLAGMLFTWALILHAPAALVQPFGDGNLVISLLECIAFTGIALLIAGGRRAARVPTRVDS